MPAKSPSSTASSAAEFLDLLLLDLGLGQGEDTRPLHITDPIEWTSGREYVFTLTFAESGSDIVWQASHSKVYVDVTSGGGGAMATDLSLSQARMALSTVGINGIPLWRVLKLKPSPGQESEVHESDLFPPDELRYRAAERFLHLMRTTPSGGHLAPFLEMQHQRAFGHLNPRNAGEGPRDHSIKLVCAECGYVTAVEEALIGTFPKDDVGDPRGVCPRCSGRSGVEKADEATADPR